MSLKRLSLLSSLLGVSALVLAGCADNSTKQPNPNIPVHKYGATAGGGSLGLYTVRQGETVWMISQRYNLALRDILDANYMRPPYSLSKGQRLSLPAPQTYKVRSNDSLYTISRLFNTSTTEIARLNKLTPPYKLTDGQVLRLPPQYKLVPVSLETVSMPVPVRPPLVETSKSSTKPLSPRDRIEREALPPPIASAEGGRYVPPPSSSSDYVDDAPAYVKPASATTPAKTIGKAPQREGKFIKPVAGKVISGYGLKSDGLHNDGVNIQAAKGDPVRAAESGVIAYTGNQIAGYGNLILIRHADQYVTAYAHVDKTLVKKGDVVKRGQTIGTVGTSGSVDKPQLHFEIRRGTKALDPSDLVKL